MHGCTYPLILTVNNVSLTYFAQFYFFNVKSNSFLHFQENIIPPNTTPNNLRELIRDLRRTIFNQRRTIEQQTTHINDLLSDTRDLVQAYRLLNAKQEQFKRLSTKYFIFFYRFFSKTQLSYQTEPLLFHRIIYRCHCFS
jgi:hypothetical protein